MMKRQAVLLLFAIAATCGEPVAAQAGYDPLAQHAVKPQLEAETGVSLAAPRGEDDAFTPPTPPMTLTANEPPPATLGDWATFLTAVGGASGLGAFGIAALVVQGLMLLLRTKVDGKPVVKLAAVTGLSVLAGPPILQHLGGLDLPSAMMHSVTLAAAQVYGHQLFSQTKKAAA